MFESLFGAETPLAVRFFIAFIVVFALIGATAWLVRRFGTARLGGHAARGRQPRLAVIEAGAVDGRRKLVLVRRDNIEHLLMIGGPTDIVIEQNIVRAATAREATPARTDTAWPAEPTPRSRPVVMDEHIDDDVHVPMPTPVTASPPLPRRVRTPAAPAPAPAPAPTPVAADPLAGLAAELSTRESDHAPHRATPPAVESPRRSAPSLDGVRPSDGPAPRREPAAPRVPEPTPMLDSIRDRPASPAQDPLVAMISGAPPAAPRAPADTNLAEMAQRLEAALRRQPGTGEKRAKAAGTPAAPEAPAARPEADKPDAAPATAPEQSPFSSLEDEMANLLGRPPGKG